MFDALSDTDHFAFENKSLEGYLLFGFFVVVWLLFLVIVFCLGNHHIAHSVQVLKRKGARNELCNMK